MQKFFTCLGAALGGTLRGRLEGRLGGRLWHSQTSRGKQPYPAPKFTEKPGRSPKPRKWNRQIQWFQKLRKQHLALFEHGRFFFWSRPRRAGVPCSSYGTRDSSGLHRIQYQ